MIPNELGGDFLSGAGLNLQAVFDCRTCPETILQPMKQSGIPVEKYGRLVLLGHGGRKLWQAVQAQGLEGADPIDQYSLKITRQYIRQFLDNAEHLILYPLTDYLIPLTQLGELAGWSHPAPIGLGINPTFGVWFAYRVAFLVNSSRLPIIDHRPPITNSPCASCTEKPCLSACPAGAVSADPAKFDIFTCANYRIKPHSACADRCLARMACPIAPEHRYSLPQIRYHYGQSLQTIREYMEERD